MKQTMTAIVDDTTELFQLFQELEERTKDMSEVDKAEEYAILSDWLGDTEESFNRKVDGYVSVIREFKAKQQAAKDEAKRLTDRAKSFDNSIESLKDMLQHSMKRLGIDKCKTAMNTVSISKNGGKAPMDINENLITKDFQKWTVDRTKIYNALKDGQEVEGAVMLERGSSLRIR